MSAGDINFDYEKWYGEIEYNWKNNIAVILGGLVTLYLIAHVLDIYVILIKAFTSFLGDNPGKYGLVGNIVIEAAKFSTLIPLGIALGITKYGRNPRILFSLVILAYIVGAVFGYYQYLHYNNYLIERIVIHSMITGTAALVNFLYYDIPNWALKKPLPVRMVIVEGWGMAAGFYLFAHWKTIVSAFLALF